MILKQSGKSMMQTSADNWKKILEKLKKDQQTIPEFQRIKKKTRSRGEFGGGNK